ncbi:MAG: hypothetical protein E4G89_05955 [Methanothrix sp.]|nr:MAG: hypothetical protein E4G89_05955 [Methanothrix sp.]
MSPENAFWYLSTMAQVCATLAGLLIIAFVFFLYQLRKFRQDYRGVRAYRMMNKIFGFRMTTYLFILTLLAILTIMLGLLVAIDSVDAIGVIDSGSEDALSNDSPVYLEFRAFLIISMMLSTFLIAGGAALFQKRLNDDEKAAGGPEKAAQDLKEYNKRHDRKFMEKNRVMNWIRSRKGAGGDKTNPKDEDS